MNKLCIHEFETLYLAHGDALIHMLEIEHVLKQATASSHQRVTDTDVTRIFDTTLNFY